MSSRVGKFKRVHREANLNNVKVTDEAVVDKLVHQLVTEVPSGNVIPNNTGTLAVVMDAGNITLPTVAKNGQVLYVSNNTGAGIVVDSVVAGTTTIPEFSTTGFIYVIDKWQPLNVAIV